LRALTLRGEGGKVERAVEKLWEALGKPELSRETTERMLRWGWSGTWHPEKREMWGNVGGASFIYRIDPGVQVPRFSVSQRGEEVEISDSRFAAKRGQVFFRGDGARVREILALVRGLRPFFDALGIGDLEEALEALEKEGRGFQKRGEYFLVWGEGPEEPRFLFRGKLFGDPLLDADFLRGREVVLRFPEVELVLRARAGEALYHHLGNNFKIVGFGLRWRDGVFPEGGGVLSSDLAECHALEPDPIPLLLRKMAQQALIGEEAERNGQGDDSSHPPRVKPFSKMVRGILEEIEASEDPIEALKREGFLRRAALRTLALM
jgi:hypothetical protein